MILDAGPRRSATLDDPRAVVLVAVFYGVWFVAGGETGVEPTIGKELVDSTAAGIVERRERAARRASSARLFDMTVFVCEPAASRCSSAVRRCSPLFAAVPPAVIAAVLPLIFRCS